MPRTLARDRRLPEHVHGHVLLVRARVSVAHMLHPARGTGVQFAGLREVVTKAFPHCRPATTRILVDHADIRSLPAGQTILGQGENARTALVVDGHVGIRRTTADGREVIPIIVSTGQLASLLPIVGRPAVAETVALSPSHVAFWPGTLLLELAENDVGLALDLLGQVLLAFEAVIERLDGLMYQDAVRRVARVLDQHADILFGEPAMLSRSFLPALVGTSQEMTARVLRKLESDGVVARASHDWLQLLDPRRLAQMASESIGSSEQVHGESLLVVKT